MDTLLQTDIKFLPGVGPRRAEMLFNELGVSTFEDLLRHYPYKYTDRTRFYTISEINSDQAFIQVRGKITTMNMVGKRPKQRLTARFEDSTGSIEIIWFQGIKWVQQTLKFGVEYVIFGKPAYFNGKFSIMHPEMEESAKTEQVAYPYTYQAAYPTTEKMKSNFLTSRVIHKLQYQLLQKVYGKIPETIPASLLNYLKFPGINDTILNIHFPKDQETLKKARYRLKFEEFFQIQLGLLRQKNWKNRKIKGFVFPRIGDLFNLFYAGNLPFEMTGAQKRVMREIRKDLGSGLQMNRLLQGDVGSGKTLVALLSMLIALDNGYQVCLMAPTEILAQQHYQTFTRMLDNLPIHVRLLTGSTKTSHRSSLHEELREGELDILIGTHALIEDTVQFKNLGLVVIDEQHRFGVAQRARLWEKADGILPHILVMTATPIPRTLAMTLYGDLDISVIDELPPGRKPIQTVHYFDSKRLVVFEFLRKQIAQGRQVYIVYPLIQESEKLDFKNLYDGYESITRAFPAPEYAVSVLHGQMKPEEKAKAMDYFVKGITKIMVSTTVIEVGVDVPNASVMMIESAERFGLSQLHQLRGRVGRGADQSFCILMSGFKLSKEAKTRIDTMTRTNDGFEIAEVDMKLRGPGDLEGTQQSGVPFNLSIANLITDTKILEHARRVAQEVLEKDPLLESSENQLLVEQLAKQKREIKDWSRIS
ncbi:MAG: ATP-dependent DNA helicase RecG [Porphyromonadaceae bacterium]|nr:MAG: ATP-dependent DNA helicase RecG [Porphyromonadaceae bacterium]